MVPEKNAAVYIKSKSDRRGAAHEFEDEDGEERAADVKQKVRFHLRTWSVVCSLFPVIIIMLRVRVFIIGRTSPMTKP
jgi:hypothetical protein